MGTVLHVHRYSPKMVLHAQILVWKIIVYEDLKKDSNFEVEQK